MKKGDAGFLELLRQDPSGFLLVDSSIRGINKAETGLRFYTKEYVLAGAELARDLYKELYKIAAPLYPAKPSQ